MTEYEYRIRRSGLWRPWKELNNAIYPSSEGRIAKWTTDWTQDLDGFEIRTKQPFEPGFYTDGDKLVEWVDSEGCLKEHNKNWTRCKVQILGSLSKT